MTDVSIDDIKRFWGGEIASPKEAACILEACDADPSLALVFELLQHEASSDEEFDVETEDRAEGLDPETEAFRARSRESLQALSRSRLSYLDWKTSSPETMFSGRPTVSDSIEADLLWGDAKSGPRELRLTFQRETGSNSTARLSIPQLPTDVRPLCLLKADLGLERRHGVESETDEVFTRRLRRPRESKVVESRGLRTMAAASPSARGLLQTVIDENNIFAEYYRDGELRVFAYLREGLSHEYFVVFVETFDPSEDKPFEVRRAIRIDATRPPESPEPTDEIKRWFPGRLARVFGRIFDLDLQQPEAMRLRVGGAVQWRLAIRSLDAPNVYLLNESEADELLADADSMGVFPIQPDGSDFVVRTLTPERTRQPGEWFLCFVCAEGGEARHGN